jgi:hypothetical protein
MSMHYSSPTPARLAGPDSLLCAVLLAAITACGEDPQTSSASDTSAADTGGTGDTTATAPTTDDAPTTTADTTGTDPTPTAGGGTVDPGDGTSGPDATTGANTEGTTEATTDDATSSSTGDETGAVDRCGPDAEGPLLNCHVGCPEALFAVPAYVEEFDDPTKYAEQWTGTWAAPTVAGGSLNFGPHPMTPDWWDNYSPTWSKKEYGDTLVCARLRLTPPMIAIPDEDMFEITARVPEEAAFETGAMSLGLLTADKKLVFRTRITADQWQEHGDAPFALDRGVENTIDVLFYGQGDKYVAELRNNAYPDEITVLPATAQLSPTGMLTLLGWRDRDAVHVDRLVIGAPAAEVLDRLVAELP